MRKSNSAKLPAALLVVGLLATSACGEAANDTSKKPRAAASEAYGSCFSQPEGGRPFTDIIKSTVWLEVPALVPDPALPPASSGQGAEDDRVYFSTAAATELRGTRPERFSAPRHLLEEVAPAQRMIVGVAGSDFGVVFAAVEPGGDVTFVGNCASKRAATEFSALSGVTAGAGASALRDVVTNLAGERFQQLVPKAEALAWSDLPADKRVLDPESVPAPPPAILATVQRIPTEITVPPEWSSSNYAICSRVTLGWGECVALELATAESQWQVRMLSVATLGTTTEYFLLSESGRLDSALGRIGTVIDPIASRLSGTIRLTGDTSASSVEALRSAALGGKSILR